MLIFCLQFVPFSSWAHQPEDGAIWVSMGPTFNHLYDANEKPMYGFGLLVEGDVNDKGGLEVGLSYLDKVYSKEKNGYELTEEIQRMSVSMGYRHWFQPQFGLGLSFVTAYSMGDVGLSKNTFPQAGDAKTSAHKATEYLGKLAAEIELKSIGNYVFAVHVEASHSLHSIGHEKGLTLGTFLTVKKAVQKRGVLKRESQKSVPQSANH